VEQQRDEYEDGRMDDVDGIGAAAEPGPQIGRLVLPFAEGQ